MAKELSLDMQLHNAAFQGDLEECKKLHRAGAEINMAMIGAAKVEPQTPSAKQIQGWAFSHGACLIFSHGIQHSGYTFKKAEGGSFYTRVSMLGGPGDVPKGSFGHD